MAGKAEQTTASTTEVTELKAQLETVTKERDEAIELASTRTKELEDAGLKIDELRGERDTLKRSLTAQKGSATKARAVVEELKAAAKPRPIGHIDRDTDMRPAYLFELVDDADLVEVVFSNGRQEVAGLGPLVIEGEAWKMTNAGLKLQVPSLEVHGPAAGKPPYQVTGYALLLDGEQVAWSQRHEQLTIGAGQTYNLADDIIF